MKFGVKATLALLVCSLSWPAIAESKVPQNSSLHLGLSGGYSFTEYDNAGSTAADEFIRQAVISFNLRPWLFTEVGFSSAVVDEVRMFDRAEEPDLGYSGLFYSLGARARFRRSLPGHFVVWGLRRSQFEYRSGERPGLTMLGHIEKVTDRRNGRLELSYSLSRNALDDSQFLLSLSGQHIWFIHPSVGFGVNWSYGIGSRRLLSAEPRHGLNVYQMGLTVMLRTRY